MSNETGNEDMDALIVTSRKLETVARATRAHVVCATDALASRHDTDNCARLECANYDLPNQAASGNGATD